MAAATAAETRAREPGLLRFVATELLLWGSFYLVYLVTRGAAIGKPGVAIRHARDVLSLERLTDIDLEHLVQRVTVSADAVRHVMARYYELGFFPVVVAAVLLLALRRRSIYLELRTAMMLALAMAAVLFVVFPTAPPRLVPGLGIHDVVGMGGHDAGSVHGIRYNPYAAMPSMHVGWTLLVSVGVIRAIRRRVLRFLVALHPAVMAWAVVATGNHYVLDMVVGVLVSMTALLLPRAGQNGRLRPAPPPPRALPWHGCA
jgi:hypothetical protein